MKFKKGDIVIYPGLKRNYLVRVTGIIENTVFHDGAIRHPKGEVDVQAGYFKNNSYAYYKAIVVQT